MELHRRFPLFSVIFFQANFRDRVRVIIKNEVRKGSSCSAKNTAKLGLNSSILNVVFVQL